LIRGVSVIAPCEGDRVSFTANAVARNCARPTNVGIAESAVAKGVGGGVAGAGVVGVVVVVPVDGSGAANLPPPTRGAVGGLTVVLSVVLFVDEEPPETVTTLDIVAGALAATLTLISIEG
jgi:hypothetical protein